MKAAILAFVALAFSVTHAYAVSRAVKIACRGDYFAHCSMHAVGSPGLRTCMREVGPRLSSQCLGALAASGEIKKEKAARAKTYKAKTHVAKKVAKKRNVNKTHVTKYESRKEARREASKQRRQARKRHARRQLAGG